VTEIIDLLRSENIGVGLWEKAAFVSAPYFTFLYIYFGFIIPPGDF